MLLSPRAPAVWAAPPLMKKWVDPLAIPPVVTGGASNTIEMSMVSTTHRFHSGLAASATLAYRCDVGNVVDPGTPNAAGYLGPPIVATTEQPLTVKMVNSITDHPPPIDTSIHGAVEKRQWQAADVHAPARRQHPAAHDGGPEDVFTREHIYAYDNTQDAAGIWYHDHALGITRVNVYAGLAGGYLIRDTAATGLDTGAPTARCSLGSTRSR